MPAPTSLLPAACALVLAPLLLGIVNRTKSTIAGRRGPPLLQFYWDLAKYFRRGAVYGEATSWIFPLGPVIEGIGLCITAISYQNQLDFGVIACADHVSDIRDFTTGIQLEMALLLDAGARRAERWSDPSD